MRVGPQVIDPQPLRPWPLSRGFLVEEQHIRLDALRVEDASRQPQHRVEVKVSEQPAAEFLPAPPSNKTLSGRTTAARPLTSRMDAMCCKKFSCLLEVVRTKSCLSISRSSRA